MQRQDEKYGKQRANIFFGTPKDAGRCPIDGGVNVSGPNTQISDNELFRAEFFEYARGADVPQKMPGYSKMVTDTSALAGGGGGVYDFQEDDGTNHLLFYHSGQIYEIAEAAKTMSTVSGGVLPSQPARVSFAKNGNKMLLAFGGQIYIWNGGSNPTSVVVGTDGNDYRCVLDHTSAASSKPITGGSYSTYWVATGGTGVGEVWASGTAYTTGNLVPIVASPTAASWVHVHKNRAYCQAGSTGLIRISEAGPTGHLTWPATYWFYPNRNGETIHGAVTHGEWILFFQDNVVNVFQPHSQTVLQSRNDKIDDTVGCPSPNGFVSCGNLGTAWYSTEGIKFMAADSWRPVDISSMKVSAWLEAIPANMRSKVALGWHDGRLHVSFADENNLGVNNKTITAHIEKAILEGRPPTQCVWTGKHDIGANVFFTRLSNSGVKNELVWCDASKPNVMKRTPTAYSVEDAAGAVTDMTCTLQTKFAQLSPLGHDAWFKKFYYEIEGDGASTLTATVDTGGARQIGSIGAQSTAGVPPLTPPFLLAGSEYTERDTRGDWPVAAAKSGSYLSYTVKETSAKSFKVIKLGVMADIDGRIR